MARHRAHNAAAIIGVVVLVIVLIVGALGAYRWLRSHWFAPTPPSAHCEVTLDQTTAQLSFEQARNATIIAAVAQQRGLPPRAVSIAYATTLQESRMENLDYGDRDSLGLFQQRPSMGWGTEAEIMDPYYSTGKFFDVMVTVDDWQNADIGDVAQEVQRSGYPDAYDQHIEKARMLASALTGQSPAAWSCVVRDSAAATPGDFITHLTQAYGSLVTSDLAPADQDSPARLTLTTPTEPLAWAVAAFAQSWSTQVGVTAVSVGDHQWAASADALPVWTEQPGSGVSPTTVSVTF
ncbi:MAG: hypothetical protein LBV00_00255 [Propionibacteriaceae bacterium]|nr:hypothetical protein [Propionibacteriaceae bacterium]